MRVKVDGNIYKVKAVQVTDDAELRQVAGVYQSKYDYTLSPEEENSMLLYRLDAR